MGALDAERLARLLAEKIGLLPAPYVAEIEAFIDNMMRRAGIGDLTRWATNTSEPTFAAVWDNPEDDIYDAI